MKIGLLGGTFNPPHIGHLAIAQQVLDFTDCEEVWLVPGFKHTFQKPTAPVEDRVAMTKLMRDDRNSFSSSLRNGSITLCRLEIDHELDGNTINLLPFLPKEHDYRFIIGSDQLATFHLWGDWEKLVQQIPFLVFPRYGYPNEPLYANMTMVNDGSLIVSNISSTKIRDRVKRRLSINQFVPKSIAEYIKEKNLYRE